METQTVSITKIVPSRFQPRETFEVEALKALAVSIRDHGLLNPPIVFTRPDGMIELVAGERRTRASLALALFDRFPVHPLDEWVRRIAQDGILSLDKAERSALSTVTIPVQIRPAADEADLQGLHIVAVMENLEHANLSPLEEARGFQGLMEAYHWSQRDLAQHLNKSQGYVAQRVALLNASPELKAALESEKISTTAARAIGTLPTNLQYAVTNWALKAQKNAVSDPITSRQVEARVKQLAAFTDPNRYQLTGKKRLTSSERNSIRLLQYYMLKSQDQIDKRADRILALAEYGYNKENLLSREPDALSFNDVLDIVRAVTGIDVDSYSKLWAIYAEEVDLDCSGCAFAPLQFQRGQYSITECYKCELAEKSGPACQRIYDPYDMVKTENYGLMAETAKHGPCTVENNAIWLSPERYVEVLTETTREQMKAKAARLHEQSRAHVEPIRIYQETLKRLDDNARNHPQTHNCERCRHYHPLNIPQGLPACALIDAPLTQSWDQSQTRAPEFGALIQPNRLPLPRCEAFIARDIPQIFATKTGSALTIAEAAPWISQITASRHVYRTQAAFWAILQWFPCNRKPDERENSRALLQSLTANADSINGPRLVTLLNCLITEQAALDRPGDNKKPAPLVNPQTGETEEFYTYPLDYILKRAELPIEILFVPNHN